MHMMIFQPYLKKKKVLMEGFHGFRSCLFSKHCVGMYFLLSLMSVLASQGADGVRGLKGNKGEKVGALRRLDWKSKKVAV